MIGFFPDPLPDELLYSACARYHARAGYRSRESTGFDLFGETRAKVAADLPCNLDTLVATFPPGHRHTADGFINRNTMLPFYSPFVPPERLSVLREDMWGDRGGAVHGRLGILTSEIKVEVFRYCPACVEDDRKAFGETYWHRLHQAPGVVVCPVHKVFLESSSIQTRDRPNPEAFVTAESAVGVATARSVDEGDRVHRVYMRIAEDTAWLMVQHGLTSNQIVNRDRYFCLLTDAGFSATSDSLKTGNVVQAVGDHFSHEFLESLGCGVRE
ncbi:MAG TPA: TniQ family protein, partial [Pyrinomonadaceae bacterium]